MKKNLFKSLQTLLVFGLAFTLTSCWNFDNPLEEMSGSGSGGSGDGGGGSSVTKITVDLSGIDAKYKNDAGDQLKLALGDQVTLSFEILPAEAAGTEVTLTSGDPNIVSIEGLKVTAAGLGTTTVTAKAGDQTATLTVAIVAINLAAITPNVGTTEYNVSSDAILTGTLAENYKISIADGVSVTLKDVTINGTHNFSYQWAGITCAGNATIILEGENTVKGFCQDYPGIFIAEGKTLVIKGAGKLEASSNNAAAGIGGGWAINCGNIEIQGGIITANGGGSSAGIGTGYNATCGTITISGGSVTAKGGVSGAGIGSGSAGSEGTATCGKITISGGTVDATGNNNGAGIGCGGTGYDGTAICGDILISGGTVDAKGACAGIGSGGTQRGKSQCGNITISGGTVTATGDSGSAGIGSSLDNSTTSVSKGGSICGNITINGGTVTATGSSYDYKGAAAIGSGVKQNSGNGNTECGTINITSAVTLVTATKGSGATNSIGAGYNGTCGTVTIGGVVGAITSSPYTYDPSAAAYTMAAAATSADKGKLICEDGHIHANGEDAACTKARVAKIIYIGTEGHATYKHGLALALTDEASTMAWLDAIDACSAKNTSTSTSVTNATWLLASKDQWNLMLGTYGAGSYTALRDGFSGITGASNLQSKGYWSSTEDESDSNLACVFLFNDGTWFNHPKVFSWYPPVRACLAF